MASGSRAHGVKTGSGKAFRRQRRSRYQLSGVGMYALAGLAFVVIAGMLVVLARQRQHQTGEAAPLSGMAPDFSLPAVNGEPVTLSSFRGQKNVLLFFNEGYGCAPCWQQAQDLQKRAQDLSDANTEFIDVMVDPSSLIKSEVSRWGLKMPVLSDTDRRVSRSYNTLGFGMHADKPNHTFVFIDKTGEIRWWQDYASMRAPTDEVVQKVKALAAQG